MAEVIASNNSAGWEQNGYYSKSGTVGDDYNAVADAVMPALVPQHEAATDEEKPKFTRYWTFITETNCSWSYGISAKPLDFFGSNTCNLANFEAVLPRTCTSIIALTCLPPFTAVAVPGKDVNKPIRVETFHSLHRSRDC